MARDPLTRDERLELERLRRAFAQLQACEDECCKVCAPCVTTLFVGAPPPRHAIPRKYRRLPWAKAVQSGHLPGHAYRRWNQREPQAVERG